MCMWKNNRNISGSSQNKRKFSQLANETKTKIIELKPK